MDKEGARVIANAIYEKTKVEDSRKCDDLKRDLEMFSLRLSVQRKRIKHMKDVLKDTHEECHSCESWIPREDFEELQECNLCNTFENCEHCVTLQGDFITCEVCSELFCCDCIENCDFCDQPICHDHLYRYCVTEHVACEACSLQWIPSKCPKHNEDSCSGWVFY